MPVMSSVLSFAFNSHLTPSTWPVVLNKYVTRTMISSALDSIGIRSLPVATARSSFETVAIMACAM
jgi:hypothetical protein